MSDHNIYALEHPWNDPLDAILRFGGWTVDEALEDVAVGREFHMLWRLWQESLKLRQQAAAERDQRLKIAEAAWWREQGCPIDCPVCGAESQCACGSRHRPSR